jgi:hypothetical protein
MNIRNFGIASGIGGIGAGLLGMQNQSNPYDAASQYYNKIPGAVSPLYAPYQQAGQGALKQLQGQYGSLINDPGAMYNRVASGYQQSPGYNWQLNQGLNAANNAAAAGGMLGSPQHQQQSATVAEGLANQDYYNYLQNALGSQQHQYGLGLEGLQGLNTQGYGANDQLANIMYSMLAGQGQNAFAGQAAENQNEGTQWGNIFGGLSSLAAFL